MFTLIKKELHRSLTGCHIKQVSGTVFNGRRCCTIHNVCWEAPVYLCPKREDGHR